MKTNLLLPVLFVTLFLGALPAPAALVLPSLISDHMVLQAGKAANLWGAADPDAEILVSFEGEGAKTLARAEAVADKTGAWKLALPDLKAGQKGMLRITTSSKETVTVADVLVGEVWIGAGQSNMGALLKANDFPASVIATAVKEAEEVQPNIRLFRVTSAGKDHPENSVSGTWQVATPDVLANFSAVSWNFAVHVYRALHRPVGMIVSAVGGTPIEPWMPRAAIDSTAIGKTVWKRHEEQLAETPPEKAEEMRAARKKWNADNPTPEMRNKNMANRPPMPYWAESTQVPARLYNGMIHGIAPYTIRGFIWYQGESNSSRAGEYGELFRALVVAYRQRWGADLPFYYVEIAGFGAEQSEPVEMRDLPGQPASSAGVQSFLQWVNTSSHAAPYLREAQQTVLALPLTGVATAADVGMPWNVHPWNKKAVGDRLALMALNDVYGIKASPNRSPELKDCKLEGDTATLFFNFADGLRKRDVGGFSGFAIQGPDQKWTAATPIINGDTIVLTAKSGPIKAVRYGWAGNPILSIENKAGLPLRPFRTDIESPR